MNALSAQAQLIINAGEAAAAANPDNPLDAADRAVRREVGRCGLAYRGEDCATYVIELLTEIAQFHVRQLLAA